MVLVPLPTAADDHQRKNAATLAAGRRGRGDRGARPDRRADGRTGDRRWPADSATPAADGGGGPRARPARRGGPRRRSRRAAGRESGDVLGRTRHVHFVGVGGIGMSGIAELLANLGYTVSGSDQKRSEQTDRLATLGVSVAARTRRRPRAAVPTSWWSRRPCAADNPEVVEARARAIPVIPAGRDAGRADAPARPASPWPARTARPRPRR